MARVTIRNFIRYRHVITWRLGEETDSREITAAEYLDLGRRNPTYPTKPDGRAWQFDRAVGGIPEFDTPTGTLGPLEVAQDAASIYVTNAQGLVYQAPKALHAVVVEASGRWTLTPQPVLFSLIDGNFTETP
jgi:hypothetical protein